MGNPKKSGRPNGGPNVSKAKTGSDPKKRIERLEQIVRILEASSLSEIQYEDEDIGVTLKRGVASEVVTVQSPPEVVAVAPRSGAPPRPATSPEVLAADDALTIFSPFVGTFYRAPSPEASVFTDVGERVHKGQTVCIVEAMKLMNEIESEHEGLVLEVLVENGKSVQYGDALFRIQAS